VALLGGGAVAIEVAGPVLIVSVLTADLNDESTVAPFRQDLRSILEEFYPRNEVIDLGRVTYMSSRAVGVLLAHFQGLDRQGGTMRVCRVDPKVMPVMKQMRLDMLTDVYPTVEEAVRDPWE
jgi:anti-sigma B factor antagonist